MAILDMKVWMGPDNRILYQHYEKDVTSKQILNAGSAQSGMWKRNVHVREIILRILNTSERFEWKAHFTPELTDFMKRMELACYNQTYRKNTLNHALGTYDGMKHDHELGIKPLNRPKAWQCEQRERKKKKKQLVNQRRICGTNLCASNTKRGAGSRTERNCQTRRSW